jgi:hypothetical protein
MLVHLKFIDKDINHKKVSDFFVEIRNRIQIFLLSVEQTNSAQYEGDPSMVHFELINLINDKAELLFMSMLILATRF